MKFTLSWLKQFVETSASAAEVVQALDNIGLEVESVEDRGSVYADFIIAEIISTAPHPDADKLAVCQVYDGKNNLQIVCGAPNARAGIKVVLAPVGAVVPNGNFAIKASKIRGVESCGMMCSADELLLGGDSDGIIELPAEVVPGASFAEYAGLNDVLIDISITPNRGDCASVIGVARDLSAFGLGVLTIPASSVISQDGTCKIDVKIDDKKACREFCGAYVAGVSIGAIEGGMDAKLRAIGSGKKLPLVDISNFMMLTYGRPNHIYDADKIEGQVVVRPAYEGEHFVAIGGEEYKLNAKVTVVADDNKVLAIAGVIGGELSKVTEETKNIFVEVANFDPIAVANSGRYLNLNTDARFRFERRIDHANSAEFMARLLHKVQIHCGGQLSKTTVVLGDEIDSVKAVKFDFKAVNRMLGTDIEKDVCMAVLSKLGFECDGEMVSVPSWRQGEVAIEADLVEEIIRIHGFHHIPTIMLPQTGKFFAPAPYDFVTVLRERGMDEVLSWSFASESDAKVFGNSGLKLKNPISIELEIMRSSVLVHLVKFAENHINRGCKNVNMFELGPVYDDAHPNRQMNCLAGIRTGLHSPLSAHNEVREIDFFDVKADFFASLGAYRVNPDALRISRECPSYYHPGQSAAFSIGKTVVGFCGRLHPQALKAMGLDAPVLAFELFVDRLPVAKNKPRTRQAVQVLQPVIRDFAFILDQATAAGDLIQIIKKVDAKITAVDIFDVYQGKGVAEGKKSIAVSVRLQPQKATLIDAEIEAISAGIINAAQSKLGAVLRG